MAPTDSNIILDPYRNFVVLVMPSTIVSHASGPFRPALSECFIVEESSFDPFGLGDDVLQVWANSKCANHLSLCWGLS
jgi:hypothetical protein